MKRLRIDWNGHPKVGRPFSRLRRGIRVAQRNGMVITSTTGGVHTPTSYHYSGRAVDLASGSVTEMKRAQRAIARRLGKRNIAELFGPCKWYVKNGQTVQGAFPDHGDHIHLAI